MSALAIVLTVFAACFILSMFLIWRAFVFGVRCGVRQMHREAMALILQETERTKLRSAGLIASIDTRIAMLKATGMDADPFRSPPKE